MVPRARTRPAFLCLGIVLLSVMVLGVTAPRADARPEGTQLHTAYVSSTSWPILFIHGFNSGSQVDCGSTWNTAISYLQGSHAYNGQNLHWTGPMYKLGFYTKDTNCTANLTSEASHCSSSTPATWAPTMNPSATSPVSWPGTSTRTFRPTDRTCSSSRTAWAG